MKHVNVAVLPLILASASPRRAELLASVGIPFEVSIPDIPEDSVAGESPEEHVVRLALEKAMAVAGRFPGRIVLAADTVVVLDGKIFGKPSGRAAAGVMLWKLGGRTHRVLTGYAVINGVGGSWSGVEKSRVTMKKLSAREVDAYLDTGEHTDKAGAYAAQGEAAKLIEGIEGSYTNVVGLPMRSVAGILRELGFNPSEPVRD